MSDPLVVLAIATATGCGLVGGSFFILSAFIMRSLGDLPPAQAVAAMQAMNVRAVTFAFMTAMFGTAVLCLVVGVWAVLDADGTGRALLVVGAAAYVVGCLAVTIVANVPLNNELAGVAAGTGQADAVWGRYLVTWTRWNSLRSFAATAASVLLVTAVAVQ